MAEKNPAYVIAARTDHKADMFRLLLAGLGGRNEGVFGPNDLVVSQHTGSNMNSSVSAGGAFMYGDENIAQGMYMGYNDAAVTLTHGSAPGTPGHTRYDLVVARARDAAYSGTTNAWALEIIAGTAAATPVDPSVPNNAIVLARVSVAYGQTTVTNANITDLRPRFAASGGIAIANSARRPGATYGNRSNNGLAAPANPYTLSAGMWIYESDTGRVLVYNGSAWVTITPVAAQVATGQTRSSAAYGDLTTVGPSVTLQTGTSALVKLTCRAESGSSPGVAAMGVAVSGASSVGAADSASLYFDLTGGAGWARRASAEVLFTGLNAGSNTFTAKYRSNGTITTTFADRVISVVGLL